MQFRIGMLGLALVSVFVVCGIADQPEAVWQSPDGYTNGNTVPTSSAAEAPVATESPDRAGLVPGLASQQGIQAENKPHAAAAGQMIGFNGFDGSGTQIITLVHTGKMQIAVYHIDRSGQIHLVSSRPIDADFSLSLNVTAPLPGQIRLLGSQVK